MNMDHGSVDPAKELLDKLGDDLSSVELFHNQAMIAVYIRPEKTKGGIILANETRAEDRFFGEGALTHELLAREIMTQTRVALRQQQPAGGNRA